MADLLASVADLEALLQTDVNDMQATAALEVATAVVQAAAGARIVRVTADVVTVPGTTDRWLRLPEGPVVSVSSVSLDGVSLTVGVPGAAVTSWRLVGDRLWRGASWQTYYDEPSTVTVTYTHGYASGAQELQLARGTTLSLARGLSANPTGVSRESIDDYSVQYEAASAALSAQPSVSALLRRAYGQRAGMARVA